MSVRTYTFLLLAILVVVFIGICGWVVNSMIFRQFLDLEKSEAVTDAQRWISSLTSEVDKIDMLTFDWASWDDTYYYAQDHNAEYEQSNLVDSTFIDVPLNVIFVVDTSGQVVFGRTIDFRTLRDIGITEFPLGEWDSGHPLTTGGLEPGAGIKGVYNTSAGPMLVAARQITRSDYSGSSPGTLVMGRLLDEELCHELNARTSVQVTCSVCNDDDVKAEYLGLGGAEAPGRDSFLTDIANEHTINVYGVVPGLTGVPCLYLRAAIPRDISVQGRRAVFAAIAAVVLTSLALMILMLLVLERLVISRIIGLSRFTRRVAGGGDLSLRVDCNGQDEISNLGEDLNNMMVSLERSQETLLEAERNRTELETVKRMTATYAHEINNPLTGVISVIQMLQEEGACRQDVTDMLNDARTSADRIKSVTWKMQEMSKPKYKAYLEHSEIVDLADGDAEEQEPDE